MVHSRTSAEMAWLQFCRILSARYQMEREEWMYLELRDIRAKFKGTLLNTLFINTIAYVEIKKVIRYEECAC